MLGEKDGILKREEMVEVGVNQKFGRMWEEKGREVGDGRGHG